MEPRSSRDPEAVSTTRSRSVRLDVDVPQPPDLERHVEDLDLEEVWQELNYQMLYGKHLGLKGSVSRLAQSGDEKLAKLESLIGGLKERGTRRGHERESSVAFLPGPKQWQRALALRSAKRQRAR